MPRDLASRFQFSRRTMLRGVGVTMALPWMESRAVWVIRTQRAAIQAKLQ